ncbi:MAG: DUF2087 domain-containing protein [Arthrobacter sp.]|uniref:DUF2087 domain-containing protein n=1 Tax=unclassified Arthrobacter TaxID=235627 RepID=UPI0026552242|nr:DUF2087 domain-containing protein [Micrococcaceae bacterium]MDN5811806.1 DUF2087 domain-containing protein [Micrococcaceae bacterium]MDN5822761.1 DUF2087 domain-containing protein [Micrococcaceae bacterium]MDN5878044.1 DUF2087 domain-containing protein [Micrococcaceae bacterium]MDN5885963.1 DUF2087 domain-containing protein [Micrococcaceae bacterium]
MTRHDDEAPGPQRWRPVVAALANAEQRLLLAEVIIAEAAREGTVVSDARRSKGLDRLAGSGVLAGTDGDWRVDAAGLRSLLSTPTPTRSGATGDEVLDRFVDDGRIHTYPAKPGPRRRLLGWAALRALAPEEVLTEGELNRRLEALTSDVVTLRRYLVDAGLLTRSLDGSAYRRAAGEQTGQEPSGQDSLSRG